jgi:hypothetical protein
VATSFSLASSVIPQAGRLDTDLGLPEVDLDYVYLYYPSTTSTPGWQGWGGDSLNTPPWDAPVGLPTSPTVAVGQGFFYLATQKGTLTLNPGSATPTTATGYTNMWVRSFTVQ